MPALAAKKVQDLKNETKLIKRPVRKGDPDEMQRTITEDGTELEFDGKLNISPNLREMKNRARGNQAGSKSPNPRFPTSLPARDMRP